MTRYEGWIILASGATIVAIWTWLSRPDRRRTEANLVLFVAVGAYGIVLWVVYNLVIFHDPLYFVHSSFSSQSQQVALANIGLLGTKGNLARSLLTYGWAVLGDIGPIIVIVGLLSVAVVLVLRSADRQRSTAVLFLLGAPVAFNIVSLWLGQTTIRVPQLPPHGMWNVRYGMVALPLLAVAIGLMVGRFRRAAVPILAAAVVAVGIFATSTPITIRDGRVGTSSAADGRPELAAAYLHHHYHGGEILADDASASPLMFSSGLDLRQFVTIGFHPWYENAIASPATTVEWVVAFDGDAVDIDMRNHRARFNNFRLVMHDGRIRVLARSAEQAALR